MIRYVYLVTRVERIDDYTPETYIHMCAYLDKNPAVAHALQCGHFVQTAQHDPTNAIFPFQLDPLLDQGAMGRYDITYEVTQVPLSDSALAVAPAYVDEGPWLSRYAKDIVV